MEEQKLIINSIDFEPRHIFECGQCFRWNKQNDSSYIGIFGKNVLKVKKQNDKIEFQGICEENIKNVVDNYFDIKTDYKEIKTALSNVDMYIEKSIQFGQGIRMLNQDLWEVIISFIISANNNIPRIQKIIERISKQYGTKIIWKDKDYYAFPTKEQLQQASIEDLRKLGLGFRDKYVYETTKKISEKEINLEKLKQEKDTKKVRNILQTLPRNRTKSSRLYLIIWNAPFRSIPNRCMG